MPSQTTPAEKMHCEVECPKCHRRWAWMGDYGVSIELHGECLRCLLIPRRGLPEEAEDALVMQVVERREFYEGLTGRRVLPCPACLGFFGSGCARCQDHGWVLGYPPGSGHLAP